MCVLMPRSFQVRSALPPRRPRAWSGTLLDGGVSERPKEHASKACEGVTPPRVQIPPPPPLRKPSLSRAEGLGYRPGAGRCNVRRTGGTAAAADHGAKREQSPVDETRRG